LCVHLLLPFGRSFSLVWLTGTPAPTPQLVFLDGIQGIRDVQGVLEDGRQSLGVDFNTPRTPIHILHSSIPVADQQAVFEPKVSGQRRIILATNIAETSITIPDVVYVVDSVRVKEKRYDSSKHLSSLVSAWVGQSNLNQRAGRAGRHREGVYYGVISRARLAALAPYALVEMKRSDLSNVIMHIKVGTAVAAE
jgi:small subunit ribosomal protein S24e